MTDSELIELYFDRNEDAIRLTDEQYGKYLHKVAFNILNDSFYSEECVNDTYLRAWDSIPPTRPGIFSSFLAKITRNLALDRYKAQRAQKRGGGAIEESLDELTECVGEGDGGVDSVAISTAINRLLGGSRKTDRIVFVKRYFYAQSIKEIATAHSLGESVVKVTLYRMRQTLRVMLKQEGIFL